VAGAYIRFCPPGHSSSLKIIGQFSMPIFTPWSAAKRTRSGHTTVNSAKFSFGVLCWSAPMNVFTNGTPIFDAAVITCLR
jgi:hypothetical protein